MLRRDSRRLRAGAGRAGTPAGSPARPAHEHVREEVRDHPKRSRGRPARRLYRRLLVAALLPLACGGGERPSRYDVLDETMESTYDVDPCTLLSAEDIVQILNIEPGEPELTEYEDATLCSWRAAGDFGTELVSVVSTDAIAGTYEEYLENSEALLGFRATPEQASKVEGPGDFAVWVPSAEGGVFQFFVADHMLQVAAAVPDAQAALEVSRALAHRIYVRLP